MSEPKTTSGKRTIPVGRSTIDVLRTHRTAQVAERLRLPGVWNDDGLVFASQTGAPSTRRTCWRARQACRA